MTDAATLRIASRGSQLALWQTHHVRDRLVARNPGLRIEIEVVRTIGDRIVDVPLAKIGDKGLFTKEVDEAILEGRADLAVHSLKDVPTTMPPGLRLAGVSAREDARDVLITGADDAAEMLGGLRPGARIGTSSLRRRAQLRHLRPDLDAGDLRGNLNTRLGKLDAGDFDGIILAAAGVIRLGWADRVTEYLDPARWIPAVGQGALALVTRDDDEQTQALLEAIHDPDTAACVAAERAFMRSLEGGCQVPIGGIATLTNGTIILEGFVSDLEGGVVLRESRSGPATEPLAIGEDLAEGLRQRGADRLLAEVRRLVGVPGVGGP